MYNNIYSSHAELPSSGKLLRSTLIAAVSAVLLLVLVVLPAEYGVDPTGVGRVLQLTEMGEIKTRLVAEAAADANAATSTPPMPAAADPKAIANVSGAATPALGVDSPSPATTTKESGGMDWRDTFSFTLAPGEGTEVKMRMQADDKAFFVWSVDGGVVNYDTHGDEGGRSLSYVKGRGVASDQGELIAAFTGNHGWYWRNRGTADVTLNLQTRGTYSAIERMK